MNPTGSLDKPVSAVPPTRADVVVVGDGAAGTLVALHLLRRWRARGATGARPVVALVGPGATGRGVAYATDDPRHLLNVPAGRMSALPDDPDHLVRWARRSCDETAGPQVFLARGHYGRYLEHALAQEAGAPDVVGRLLRVPHRAVRVGARPDGRTEVVLADGGVLLAADVVLAHGVQAPGAAWAPPGLAADPA
ncbi:FAD/NAD(P)-binding protein, partial [Angustibacter speluncae]